MNRSDENLARSPFDWTRISDDPNNEQAYALAGQELRRLRRLHTDTDVLGFVQRAVAVEECSTWASWSHSSTTRSPGLAPDPQGGLLLSGHRHPGRSGRTAARARLQRPGGLHATSDEDSVERFDVVFVVT